MMLHNVQVYTVWNDYLLSIYLTSEVMKHADCVNSPWGAESVEKTMPMVVFNPRAIAHVILDIWF